MAITNVQGAVGRVFFDGKGAEIVESWQAQGETKSKRWAAFFDQPHGLSEGDIVEVSGMHGDKVDEWTDKEQNVRHTVKRTLNKARMNAGAAASAPQGAPQSQNGPESDPWAHEPQSPTWDVAQVPTDDLGTPF